MSQDNESDELGTLLTRLDGGVYGIGRIQLCKDAATQLRSLQAKVQRLQADAERFEWLITEQKSGPLVFFWNQDYKPQPYASIRGATTTNVLGHFDNIRAAIDAARKG